MQIPRHAKSELYNELVAWHEQERDNGIKNQLLKGLKKAKRLRER